MPQPKPLDLFDPLPTPMEMAAWDLAAIRDFGLKPELLMENAGAEALSALREAYGPLAGARTLLIAGGGNNGGDAFVLARRLLDEGAEPLVLHTRPMSAYRAEARYHLDLARRAGAVFRHLPPARAKAVFASCEAPDILVDGLMGTGFSGELSPEALELVQLMNELGQNCFVLALDTPSGLNGLTGQPRPEAVHADLTVAFHAPKLGSALPLAAAHVGELATRAIGIPRAVMEASPPSQVLLTQRLFSLLPPPSAEMHKGRAGHVLVLGGSEGLTGAAQLCALGALRAGAGLVTVGCPHGVLPEVKAGMPDIMALGLGQGSTWTEGCMDSLLPSLGRYDCVVIGPGLGRNQEAADFLALFPRAFASAFDKGWATPCIYDADALYHLALAPKLMRELPKNAVLTPHPGEMARLLGMGMGEVQADRVSAAHRFLSTHPQVLTLKGAGTLVGQGEMLHLSPITAPNLAVGGSGDVLAGVIAAVLARGIPPLQAACLGVYWHGLCGLALAREFPGRGNLASEIAHALPHVLKEYTPC
ncbi:MAG: NAD(P)H-hydrate dehydratase [Proteobacteria bacterium]|nr:NAD(P)H-hydrate dehydratase [Pseudomonadota bacterium]MBU1594414.1 NAD(P)H-hydrate dehydratase [Pseudomonadota bacterium]